MKFYSQRISLKRSSSEGFTLIEVVLVLAIGGLIFLLAFIAFQQVSRNRRDTQRRSDIQRVVAELENFKSNTGRYPIQGMTFDGSSEFTSKLIPEYMGGDKFQEPSGSKYYEAGVTNSTVVPDETSGRWPIEYKKDFKCINADFSQSMGSVAVKTKLESGAFYCKSSQ